jgi:hypothetical protein
MKAALVPKRYGPMLFGLILSGLMSLLVSGISTFRAIGLAPDFLSMWSSAWLAAWVFAFPVVVLAAPIAQKVVQHFIAKTGTSNS